MGKEGPFLASDTSFPQQFPASSPPPWPLDTQGPGPGGSGEGPEAGTFSVCRGFSPGVSISSSLETADSALKEVVDKSSTEEACPQPSPVDPEWAGRPLLPRL